MSNIVLNFSNYAMAMSYSVTVLNECILFLNHNNSVKLHILEIIIKSYRNERLIFMMQYE